MTTYDFDLFTIGAGSGGIAASNRAASYGAKVAVCEAGRIGGTCVLRGCVPKKLLVYGTHFREEIADAAGYGWTIHGKLDWATLIRRKDDEIERLSQIYISRLRDAGATLIEGPGRIVDGHTVEVGGRRWTARHILIATGGHPTLPTVPGIEHAITSNEALSLSALPERVAIVGGGYIAAEFACIFHAAGVKVTVLLRGATFLRGFDDDVRTTFTTEMTKKGIELQTATVVEGIERRDQTIRIVTEKGEMIETDVLLYATGRKPTTAGLGAAEAGVQLGPAGEVLVDPMSRSSVESIYAVGDCTNRMNLTPVAVAEGRAVAESLFNARPMAIDHHNVPTAVFSQPPVSTIGLTEREARARFGPVDIYVSSFRPMKHTLSGRDERTMMKLIVDRVTDRVLGCHMIGTDAPEIIQGFAVAIRCGATKQQLDTTIGIHPSAGEELLTMRKKLPDPESDTGLKN